MGHGELILGHSHPLEVEWAERIRGLMPAAERIEFFASGQEANQMGVRLLKFKHNYHGWADGARRGTGESGLRGGAAGEWRGPGSPGGWR